MNDTTSTIRATSEDTGGRGENGTPAEQLRRDAEVRRYCRGTLPLEPRLEPWMVEFVRDREHLHGFLGEHGSPMHVLHRGPFERNGRQLLDVARRAGVELGLYFARKANKALVFVDAARDLGWGVDVAGYEELRQVLDRNVPAERLVVTAAVKPRRLLELAAERRVLVALDNAEEARALARQVDAHAPPLAVAVRLSGFHHEGKKLFSRFGFDIDQAGDALGALWREPEIAERLTIEGLHFHLDGYDPDQRVSAIDGCLHAIDQHPQLGAARFLDIGGGLPVRYLDDAEQWRAFWQRLDQALLGRAQPITYRNHGLGRLAVDGRVVGQAITYPFYQPRVATTWLEHLLAAELPSGRGRVAAELAARGLELRLEPGRSLLYGCGLTAARVEWTKDHPDGHRVAALDMNRTQCRTGSADYLVDPLLVPAPDRQVEPGGKGAAPPTYLTGAYCIENEMLAWRSLHFPHGLEAGDAVVWPNTAGYFMHFLESRSHQFPLARNWILDEQTGRLRADPIDRLEGP